MKPWRAFLLVLLLALPSAGHAAPDTPAALACLHLNLYHEALKKEPLDGLFAIGQATLTRAKRDPTKVCDAVRKYKQFSWTLKPPPVVDDEAWRLAGQVARLSFYMQDFTGGADHFHALICPQERLQECKPYWRLDMDVAGQWGNHLFYKPKGKP
jgi:spore germination cell wall hydrolase CwlJ-like protein